MSPPAASGARQMTHSIIARCDDDVLMGVVVPLVALVAVVIVVAGVAVDWWRWWSAFDTVVAVCVNRQAILYAATSSTISTCEETAELSMATLAVLLWLRREFCRVI